MKKNRIQCAFCEVSYPRQWPSKDGKIKHGWSSLRRHIIFDHPDKFDEVQERLLTEGGEEE